MAARRCVATIVCLALAHQHCNAQSGSQATGIPFSVTGLTTDGASTAADGDAAAVVHPPTNLPALDDLVATVNRSIINPFGSAEPETPTSTPTPMPLPSTRGIGSSSSSDPTDEVASPIDPRDSKSSSSGPFEQETGSFGSQEVTTARGRRRRSRPVVALSSSSSSSSGSQDAAPLPSPKRANTISNDVVTTVEPNADATDDETAPTDTPSSETTTLLTPSPTPRTQTHTPKPPQDSRAAATTAPPQRPSATANHAPDGNNNNAAVAAEDSRQNKSMTGSRVGAAAAASAANDHSSVVTLPPGEDNNNQTTAAASNSGGDSESSVSSSTESGSGRYSMGAASIMSIVGVIVGICVIVSLFVLISRRKYDDDDDDDDVFAYGAQARRKQLQRPSIMRLSPTFLMNSLGPGGNPGEPVEPDFGASGGASSSAPQHHQHQHQQYQQQQHQQQRARGASGAPAPVDSPALMDGPTPSQDSLNSSNRGSSLSSMDGNSVMFDTHDSSVLDDDSRSSASGWSSVLESDCDDHRHVSRCTRDTRFSNIMLSQNFSEYDPSDVARRTQAPATSGQQQPPKENDIDDTGYETTSTRDGSAASCASAFSDYRSTNQSYQSARYTGDSHIHF